LGLIQPICNSKERSPSAYKHGLKKQADANFNASFLLKGNKKHEIMIATAT